VRTTIDEFLLQAKRCAQKGHAEAALLTVFPVIMCVSEAIGGGETLGTRGLFQAFVREMNDWSSWIIPPTSGTFSEGAIAEKLADLRNALTHELSKPSGILWLQRTAYARDLFPDGHPEWYLLGVVEFIAAVKKTVDKLIQSHPDATFDPKPRGPDRQVGKLYLISPPRNRESSG